MTVSPTTTPSTEGQAENSKSASSALGHRAWLCVVLIAVVLAHVAKFPTMRDYLDTNAHRGPDTSDASPQLVSASLDVGAALGLFLSVVIGVFIVIAVHRRAPRSGKVSANRPLFPYWLSGVVLVGLVVPDLVSAATGVITVTSTSVFYIAYIPLAGLALALSPAPKARRLRLLDVVLLIALPFV